MEYTENLTLALVGDDDLFDEAYLNANFEKIDSAYAELSQRSGGGAPAIASAVAEGVVGTVGAAEMVYGMDIDLMSESWEQGSLSDSNGSDVSTSTRIRMSGYFDVSAIEDFKNKSFTVRASTNNEALMFSWELYAADKSFISSSLNDWYDSGKFTLPGSGSDIAYIRLILRKTGNGSITPEELTSARLMIL